MTRCICNEGFGMNLSCPVHAKTVEKDRDDARTAAHHNDAADDRLRCFAINCFGGGDHPHADSASLQYFKAPYVRECLLKCAASENVMPFARERAADLAEELS
jgi:hypothetical protein